VNFLALLTGIVVERWLTRFFRLREFRWLDRVFDFGFGRVGRSAPLAVAALGLLGALLVLPVAALQIYLARGWLLIAYFAFAVLILLFSLGPRDLRSEVEDLLAALSAGDRSAVRRLRREITELPDDSGDDGLAAGGVLERSIYVQANNRLFGVVFWFFALGPIGAWTFRVFDLMRRRAVFVSTAGGSAPVDACAALHGLIAWIPARLMAAGFALAGNFQSAFAAWSALDTQGVPFHAATSRLIGALGPSARGELQDRSSPSAVSLAALSLVGRTLLLWFVVIALLTLNEWLI
jgi:AmpE protein